jgi:hypothetical protein
VISQSERPENQEIRPRTRRSGPRVEVLGQLHGQVVTWRVPLTIRDISAGGFAVESEWRFPLGSTHMFRFTTDRGEVVFLNGRTVHTRPASAIPEADQFISGFAFLRDGDRVDQAIALLLDAATATMEFDAEFPRQ